MLTDLPHRGAAAETASRLHDAGTIAHLTRWVLDAALRQCAEWRLDYPDLTVAVNLAAANVLDVGLPAMVQELLTEHGLPGDALECEVSETTVMSDPQRVTEVLAALRRLGVRLSLDDFGTGQASLAYLKQLPLDEVKIDRAFVTTMADDNGDAVIVRSTIDLARNSAGLGAWLSDRSTRNAVTR